MDFSTPGGQATHAFEFAEEIRKLCTDNSVNDCPMLMKWLVQQDIY